MSERTGIVLIDTDDASRQFVKELARELGQVAVEGEASDLGRGFELVRQFHPGIVILDLYPSAEHALRFAERVLQEFPRTVLLVTSFENATETVIRSMRAGVREFLSKPLRKEEMENAIRNAIRFLSRQTGGDGHSGKLLSVFGVKGGVGATTIAANLAVNLAGRTVREVALVDLNLQLGNAALFLNLRPRYSIVDVSVNLAEIDPAAFRRNLARHDSGVSLIGGPRKIEDAELLQAERLDALFGLLRATFDYIVVDLPAMFDDITMKTLDLSDQILTVFTADIPSISNALRCFELFKRLEYGEDKVLPVLNRFDGTVAAAIGEVQKSFRYPLYGKIPNQDYATMINSINHGIPLSTAAPRSPSALSIMELSVRLDGNSDNTIAAGKETEKKGLFRRLLFRKDKDRAPVPA